MNREISEPDWKLWRKISGIALERFCQRTLEGLTKFASGSDNAHERYVKLFKYIHKADKKIAIAFNDVKRSTAIDQLVYTVAEGMVTREELAQFSEETQEIVRLWLRED